MTPWGRRVGSWSSSWLRRHRDRLMQQQRTLRTTSILYKQMELSPPMLPFYTTSSFCIPMAPFPDHGAQVCLSRSPLGCRTELANFPSYGDFAQTPHLRGGGLLLLARGSRSLCPSLRSHQLGSPPGCTVSATCGMGVADVAMELEVSTARLVAGAGATEGTHTPHTHLLGPTLQEWMKSLPHCTTNPHLKKCPEIYQGGVSCFSSQPWDILESLNSLGFLWRTETPEE